MGRRRRRNTTPTQGLTAGDVRAAIRAEVAPVVAAEVGKALALPAGAVATPLANVDAYTRRGAASPATALPRDPFNSAPFGPGQPLFPAAIDPLMQSGRPAPRVWDAPITWNLDTTTQNRVPWSVLRDAADGVSVMRSCIEVRKSEMIGLEWSFGVNTARARAAAERSGEAPAAAAAAIRRQFRDDIERFNEWWTNPDPIRRWSWSEWLNALLEDSLVIDANPIYPHLTWGGTLHAAELIDGATIKPLLDYRGVTPQPPYPAFQQILHGFPRGELEAMPGQDVSQEFTSAVYGRPAARNSATDALIYKVRSTRTGGPYGFSCVEQALADIDLWLKRFGWLGSEFSDGVTPEMLVNVDANLTPEQLRQYESVFNDDLSGRSRDRHRARFLPAGFVASYPGSFDAKFSSDFDFHLVRLICAAFDVLPTSIGFTPNHGTGSLGSSTQQDGERVSQLQRATKPTAQWVTNIINEISRNYLGMAPEITFQFHGIDEDDEAREAGLLTGYVGSGLRTLNEGRDQLNLPRYDFPEADQPYLSTPTGPAFLNVAVQPVDVPGNLPGAAATNAGNRAIEAKPAEEPDEVEGAPEAEAAAVAKTAEAAVYRRWMRKNRSADRRFELKALTSGDLDTFGIDPATVTVSAGKACGPHGPVS